MLTYVIIGLWIYSSYGSPIQQQNLKGGPLVYYTPTSQYVQGNLYHPFVQYPQESSAFGKALQSLQSQNEILFYPNPAVVQQQQSVLINAQHGNVPLTRFTAPPKELVGAVYAWFAENNIPIPEGPNRSDISPEKLGSKEHDKPDSSEKTAGEADVLAEADRNPNFHFPKKPVSPKFNPGQRFYILNGQPQFVSNYQPPLPRVQPYIPQLLTRNAIPAEPQNIFFLQSQPELQQNLNLKTQQVQEQTNQNVVLVENPIQSDIKPMRYHSTELKPQNYVLLRENQQQENNGPQIQVQPLVPTYSRQQLLIGRLLPQTQEIKQQQIQTPIHQTHYVPVEVVPPQVPQFQPQQFYQNQDLREQETNPQPHLAFIHIPVDRNIQPPQYITAKTPVPGLQQPSSAKQLLYLSQPQVSQVAQQRIEQTDNQFQQQVIPNTQSGTSDDLAPGIAALEFARYITSKQGDLYSDSVVIDAKTEEDKREEDNESEVVQADNSEEPSIAQAQPGGIALAGPGGVAATAPRGTALVGEKGLAVASPHATAVAGPTSSKNKENRS